jgi:hypothetical protein
MLTEAKKDKKPRDHLNRYRKSLQQNSTSFHDKSSDDIRNRRMYLNIIKAIYDKPIDNIIVNRGKTETISSKVRNETGCPLSPFLFNVVLEFLARAMIQEEEIKGKIQIVREVVKITLSYT